MNNPSNHPEHRSQILEYNLITKTQHTIPSRLEKTGSHSIISSSIRGIVHTAIQFNNQFCTRRTKICDVTPNGFLTFELDSSKIFAPQSFPQNRLSRRLCSPILSSQSCQIRLRHEFSIRDGQPSPRFALRLNAPPPRCAGEGLGERVCSDIFSTFPSKVHA